MQFKDTIYLHAHLINFRFNFIIVLTIYLISLFLFNDSSNTILCDNNEEIEAIKKNQTNNLGPYFYFLAGSLASAAIILLIIYAGGKGSPSSPVDESFPLENIYSNVIEKIPSNLILINSPAFEKDPVTGFITGIWDIDGRKLYMLYDEPDIDVYVSVEAFIQTYLASNFSMSCT